MYCLIYVHSAFKGVLELRYQAGKVSRSYEGNEEICCLLGPFFTLQVPLMSVHFVSVRKLLAPSLLPTLPHL